MARETAGRAVAAVAEEAAEAEVEAGWFDVKFKVGHEASGWFFHGAMGGLAGRHVLDAWDALLTCKKNGA